MSFNKKENAIVSILRIKRAFLLRKLKNSKQKPKLIRPIGRRIWLKILNQGATNLIFKQEDYKTTKGIGLAKESEQ
jgi:hypothetical protein